ncbi:hypothetical protein [Streptomyces sp. SID12488]|uniref:hypothetical protein n=1 Tax=Streptomyces sp. SID12488 TaxID=2706040 RepID=UPI0013D90114|nr:hypothetical protein [Streptomyces sp. SID12488]NEA68848.1 hypothetical protein [Streptomyces sp. SID12488]
MSSVHTLPAPSAPAQVFAPWRTMTPGQALPWRSLASLGLDPDLDLAPDPGAENVPGAPGGCGADDGRSPGSSDVVESVPVPRHPVHDHHPMPQEA